MGCGCKQPDMRCQIVLAFMDQGWMLARLN
jgi:hypothetical protein